MGIRLDKTAIISLYYYCRQAARSLDRVLGIPWDFENGDYVCKRDSEALWQGLRDYYDPQKREEIQAQVNLLTNLGDDLGKVPTRASILQESAFFRLLLPFLVFVRTIANLWKSSWSFSTDEISFLLAKLTRFMEVLEAEEPGPHQEMLNLLMDLSDCQRILEQSCLFRDLRWASRAEHYLQNDIFEHVSLEQIGVARKALVRN